MLLNVNVVVVVVVVPKNDLIYSFPINGITPFGTSGEVEHGHL